MKKNKILNFWNFKEEFKNLKFLFIGSSTNPSKNIISYKNIDYGKSSSDEQYIIKDSFCGQIKSFFLLDQDLSSDNAKKIEEFYSKSQTLSQMNYDSEFETSILLNINSLTRRNQLILDDNWLALNKSDKILDLYILFNEECDNSNKKSFLNKINILRNENKKKIPNYNDFLDKKEVRIGDIKQRGVAFVGKSKYLNAFLSVANMDIFLYTIELLSEFKYIQEKKANFIVSDLIGIISAFIVGEKKPQSTSKEISEFFKKYGLNYFSLLLNRVYKNFSICNFNYVIKNIIISLFKRRDVFQ